MADGAAAEYLRVQGAGPSLAYEIVSATVAPASPSAVTLLCLHGNSSHRGRRGCTSTSAARVLPWPERGGASEELPRDQVLQAPQALDVLSGVHLSAPAAAPTGCPAAHFFVVSATVSPKRSSQKEGI